MWELFGNAIDLLCDFIKYEIKSFCSLSMVGNVVVRACSALGDKGGNGALSLPRRQEIKIDTKRHM